MMTLARIKISLAREKSFIMKGKMSTVVFDIETVGMDWNALDEAQRTYLLKNAKSEEEQRLVPQWLSLWPMTGKIVVLAMQNVETGRGRVWYERSGGRLEEKSDDGSFDIVGDDEGAFLEEFWKTVPRFDRFVTFNGRGFDCPWVMLRSAILGVRPSRNLMGYRYTFRPHVDLLEVLTFFGGGGTAARKFNLDFFCKAFGIPSPKEAGMDGYAVGPYYREGRIGEIAAYCRRDVEATAELYRKVEATLLPVLEGGRA
jgi:DNA polymerase elongation subunit (family B)